MVSLLLSEVVTMQWLIRLRRKEREGHEVWGAWILKKSDSPIGEPESKGHAIQWPSMVSIAKCFDFAHFVPFPPQADELLGFVLDPYSLLSFHGPDGWMVRWNSRGPWDCVSP
jgi:hypothetical protein